MSFTQSFLNSVYNTQDRIQGEWMAVVRNGDMDNFGRGCVDLDLDIVS